MVVDASDDRTQRLLEQLEIEQKARRVEFSSGQGDTDLVVVPVRVLALALVVAKIMAGRKTSLHVDFKHRLFGCPVRGRVPGSILFPLAATLPAGGEPCLFT